MAKYKRSFFGGYHTSSLLWKKVWERFWVFCIAIIFLFIISFMAFFLILLLVKGSPRLSWEFIFGSSKDHMAGGGIFPAMIGTLMVTFVSGVFSIFMGMVCGIYLAEYAKDGWLKNWIWTSVKNLAGIPSVIYGLFGLAIFINALSMNKSALTAGLTLGILSLPTMISATFESIKGVPFVSRQASFGLGASHWQTLSRIILPTAFPGILTGMILSLTRSLGETAPILFTGVAYYIAKPDYSLGSPFMALPYHIFTLATQNSLEDKATHTAYGSSLVLVLLVVFLSVIPLIMRWRMRRKKG